MEPLNLFTVYDIKKECYLPPFCMRTTAEAVRGFVTTLNDDKTDYFRYPQDFTLFHLGSYDDRTAKFDIYAVKISLGNGIELKRLGQTL